MKFENKEDLMTYYNNLWETRQGNVCEWMQITWNECRMYQRERENFPEFMFKKHNSYDDYNRHVANKRKEYRALKDGDTIKYIGEKCNCFTKNKTYEVSRNKEGFSQKDIWFISDIGKYGYIVEDDYIYYFELVSQAQTTIK